MRLTFSAVSFRGQAGTLLAAYGVVIAIVWQSFVGPARSALADRQVRLAALSSEAGRIRAGASGLREDEREVTALQESIARAIGAPAGRRDMPAVVQDLYELAAETGIRLTSVTPKPLVTNAQLTESAIEVGFSGGYRDLERFFSELAAARMLLLASDVHISSGSANTLLATCLVTAVTFIDDNEERSPLARAGGAK
jgi:Tfp pilus assembly protein PilO